MRDGWRLVRQLVAAALLSFCLGAETPSQTGRAIVFFDETFAHQAANAPHELNRTRPPLVLPDGRRVTTCRALLELPDRTAAIESVREDHIFQEYQTCFALETLRLAREPADRPTVDDRPPAATLRERLDLRSFPNSLRPRMRAKAGAITLAQLGLVTTMSSSFTVTVSDPQWTFRLTVLAAADFDADGREDWLVRLVDLAKTGSYVGSCILVVHEVRDPGLLTASCVGTP